MIAFLIALPLAVYTLAGLFLFLDRDDPVRSLLSLAFRLLLVALLLALSSESDRIWVGAAFLTVIVLHLAFHMAARHAVTSDKRITGRID